MKLTLTHTQFMCLYNLFQTVVVNDNSSREMQDKLIHLLMLQVYQKLYKKAVEKKKEYTIKLEASEAMAFWLYWIDHSFTHSSLEGNLLTQTINKIDQQYA